MGKHLNKEGERQSDQATIFVLLKDVQMKKDRVIQNNNSDRKEEIVEKDKNKGEEGAGRVCAYVLDPLAVPDIKLDTGQLNKWANREKDRAKAEEE